MQGIPRNNKGIRPRIQIPRFTPRDYQLPFLKAMDNGLKRAVLVWHRRAGKEVACFNFMIKQAVWHRVGTYVYFFPTSTLGRRILWDGANKDGKRFLDYVPKEIIEGNINNNEMKIRLTNGSVIQVIGSDQIVNVGINPVGCVFSEFSLQDPKCWNFIRPILRENDGWAVFNFTPRGKNHAHDMYLMAKNNPAWFYEKLTIRETGVLTEEDMESERGEGMSEHLIQQEYYCSFDQGVEGAYYAKLLNRAELDGRLTNVPYDYNSPVDTYWDLGVSDETVILLAQNVGNEIHIINMYRNQGEGLHHYVRWLKKEEKEWGYIYGTHYAPHDIQVRELGSGAQTRLQIARDLGIRFEIVPNISIQEGVELCRGVFPKLWVNAKSCSYFIKAAENYHKKYNEKYNVYSDKPVHDWSSHCFVGETEIWTRKGLQRIMDLPPNGEILTLCGWRSYTCPRMTRKNARVVEVTFQDGTQVKCTPDHLFLTEKWWKSAGSLKKGTVIQSSLTEEFNISLIDYLNSTRALPICTTGTTDCMNVYGKKRMGRFLPTAIYTIKMGILKTIICGIWNVWTALVPWKLPKKKEKNIPSATPLAIKSIKKIKSTADVWCLTVPNAKHFSLSNGAVVHNCMDAFRYLAVSQHKKSRGRMSEEEANIMEENYSFRHV